MRGRGKSTTAATKSDKPRTLAERRLNQYGIGNNISSENSRVTCKRQVDYLKLNDGLDVTPYEPSSPKSKKKKKNYVPSRSGPTTSRQRVQKARTSSPVQELECALEAINLSNQTVTEITAVTSTTMLSGVETLQTMLPSDKLSGVHPSTNVTSVNIDTVPGVQSTLAGVQSPPDGSHLLATDNKLPDLVITKKDNKDEYSAVLDSVPPVGEKNPDHIFDGATTEEEFDAVDALLSLSTPRDITTDNVLDEDSSLMPVGGPTPYEDVNPVPIHLDQVTIDGAIAEIVEQEDILDSTQLSTANNSCSICGVRKRSVENLNAHHRRRHEAQMCGICGKVFELASTLMHHMYTHDKRHFFCEKCLYHCHFKSELKKHNVTHDSQPSHQCMHKNCG